MNQFTDTTFAKIADLPLFDIQERPRKEHPIGSHARADDLNADGGKKLTDQMIQVLRIVIKYPGRTAAELGEKMAMYDKSKYEWPHKYLLRLETAGMVNRIYTKENKKQYTCLPTDDARIFIEELDDTSISKTE